LKETNTLNLEAKYFFETTLNVKNAVTINIWKYTILSLEAKAALTTQKTWLLYVKDATIRSMVVNTEKPMDSNIIKETIERKGNNGAERTNSCAMKK
jgi:hypothetical protein